MLPFARSLSSAARRSASSITHHGSVIAENKPYARVNTALLEEQDKLDTLRKGLTVTPFKSHAFVRPFDLTYKGRKITAPPPKTRPALGPSRAEARKKDVFHALGIDPLSQCMNPRILTDPSFMSEMAKIYGRNVTRLTQRSQRRLGKAIRRAKMMGVVPILSRRNILGSGVSW